MTLNHKEVLSPFQGNILEMCPVFWFPGCWSGQTDRDVSTWVIIFFSSSFYWAKPLSPCNPRRRTGNPAYSNALDCADYRASPIAISVLRFQHISSYGAQSMVGHLPRFPHAAQLQHFQAPPSWWWPQDCSLKGERLKYCFYQDRRMRGNHWLLLSLNHPIFSGLQYHQQSFFFPLPCWSGRGPSLLFETLVFFLYFLWKSLGVFLNITLCLGYSAL